MPVLLRPSACHAKEDLVEAETLPENAGEAGAGAQGDALWGLCAAGGQGAGHRAGQAALLDIRQAPELHHAVRPTPLKSVTLYKHLIETMLRL